jgi:CHAD domain-containing protein
VKRFVRDQTFERLEKLDREFQTLVQAPTNPDLVHHVRVATRRLSQCLRLFADCFDEKAVDKLHRRSRQLLQRCGAVRDCDIALKLLKSARVRDKALIGAVEEQRQIAHQALAQRLDRLQTKRAWKDWRKRLRVASSCSEDPKETAQRILPKKVKEWLAAGNAAAKSHSHKSLHRFRLLGKRLRYTLELFTDVDENIESLLKRLRTVQDQLGAINDCATALPMVQGHPGAKVAIIRLLHSRERQFPASWTREREKRKQGGSWKSIFSDTAKPNRKAEAKPVRKKTSRTKTAN